MKDPNRFYVYAYYEPGVAEPFYIGKGRGRRAYAHLNPSSLKRKSRFYSKLRAMLNRKVAPRVELLHEYLTEGAALEIERELIAKYGRLDLGTGCLCNHTDGGEGMSGFVMSAEAKAKMSASHVGKKRAAGSIERSAAAHRGRKHSPEAKAKMAKVARSRSPECFARMAATKRGTSPTPEARARSAAATKATLSVPVRSVNPTTGEVCEYAAIVDVAADGFRPGHVSACCSGRQQVHRGLRWEYQTPTSTVA